MKFKSGDKVECIDPTNTELTLGKTYEIWGVDFFDNKLIYIINDSGRSVAYNQKRFLPLNYKKEIKPLGIVVFCKKNYA